MGKAKILNEFLDWFREKRGIEIEKADERLGKPRFGSAGKRKIQLKLF